MNKNTDCQQFTNTRLRFKGDNTYNVLNIFKKKNCFSCFIANNYVKLDVVEFS